MYRKKILNITIILISFMIIFINSCFAETNKESQIKETEIVVDWALFPRVYCINNTAFIPVKFTVNTPTPETFSLTPLIITDKTSKVKIPENTPNIKLTEQEQTLIKFIPFEVGEEVGQYNVSLVFVDGNGVIYPNVKNSQESVSVFSVNLVMIIFLIILNITIISFYKIFILRFLKQNSNRVITYLLNGLLALEIFLFSYIFMAPWNISLAVSLILIAFLFCRANSRLFMPFVFGAQLLMLELYMDLLFGVKESGIIISVSQIIFTTTILFIITFFFRRLGMVISSLLSILGVCYYVSQIYYQNFFQDFYPIASLYQVKDGADIYSSVITLTSNIELMILVLLVSNFVIFYMYKKFTKSEILLKKEQELLLLSKSNSNETEIDNKLLEIQKVKRGFLRTALNWASIKGFHKM